MTQIIDKKTDYSTAGKRTRRQDGYDKLVGRTRYAGDLAFAGLLHARLVLSPYAHARIVNIDTISSIGSTRRESSIYQPDARRVESGS